MFTTPCFIRKNTPELRKKLEELGYYPHPSEKKFYEQYSNYVGPFLHTGRGFYATIPIGYDEELRFEINCETNEELFLAIAALRDDSDYMQWFVSKGWKDGFGNVEDKWVLCDQDTLEYFGAVNNSPNTYNRKKYPEFGWHKATVKELIEHFKTL